MKDNSLWVTPFITREGPNVEHTVKSFNISNFVSVSGSCSAEPQGNYQVKIVILKAYPANHDNSRFQFVLLGD